MGLADFEVFMQERLRAWDESVDLSSGSPIDTQVIQPVLQRLGTDPFTLDAAAFIYDRLAQEHPEIAVGVGDATADLLIKQALMLWDPIIREIKRVSVMLSFKDPYLLNTDEAEAIGANLFSTRNKGKYARGVVRIYFSQPQNFSLTQSNYVSASNGLRYFPTQIQSVRREEMLLNAEGELYYFDASYTAEAAGEAYNLEAGSIVTVANVAAAIRVTNKNRFREGLDEDDAVTFVGKIARELTERSLVTLRGIVAKLANDLPEVTQVQVIGYGDPEMSRDILSGGGLGPIITSNTDGAAVPDGHFALSTYRMSSPGTNFFALIGPPGPVTGWVMTIYNAFLTGTPVFRDVAVTRVIDATTLELAESILARNAVAFSWMLRKWELTLSGIPGGILFPDGPNGTLRVPNDQLHIGGCTDTYTRSAAFESSTLVVDVASDDAPTLSGLRAAPNLGVGTFSLDDIVLGFDYLAGDATYVSLETAAFHQYALEVLDGNNAGIYRILSVQQSLGSPPLVTVDPTPPSVALSDTARWRLFDEIDVDLVEPKETRIAATDGQTYQNVYTFTTVSGAVNFDALGVSVGDILRIDNGEDAGDFVVEALIAPSYTSIQVDKPFTFTTANVSYRIFRSNTAGGVQRPLIRITDLSILDTTGQPVGVSIPYACPVSVTAGSFSNIGRGVREEVQGVLLGLISAPHPFLFVPGWGNLVLAWEDEYGTTRTLVVTGLDTLGAADALDVTLTINSAALLAGIGTVATVITNGLDAYCGIRPIGTNTRVDWTSDPNIVFALFGFYSTAVQLSAGSIRKAGYNWTLLQPSLSEDYDVVEVVDGIQPGFYGHPVLVDPAGGRELIEVSAAFEPEAGRLIRVGSRSIGSARLQFLDPTSFEVDQTTVFSATDDNGVVTEYFPDPQLTAQLIPPLPGGVQPKDGVVSAPGTLNSASQDFIRSGVRVGDQVVLTYRWFEGTAPLADPIVGLAGTTIIISLDDGPDRVITFLNDYSLDPTAVTRDGAANQINAWLGFIVCAVVENPGGSGNYFLRFDTTRKVTVRTTGSANLTLGFNPIVDTSNLSVNANTYPIYAVATTSLDFTVTAPCTPETEVQFQIVRPGTQRISSTVMKTNVAPAGLYYCDIELVSAGTGDQFNLRNGQTMAAVDYRSDGYYLTTNNVATSLSTVEDLWLHISRSIIEPGADDSPLNATQIAGQQLSVAYEYSASVASNQALQSSETERVVCQNPLARSLVPHFVRFDLTYKGGSKESVVTPLLEDYVRQVAPADAIESSDLQKIVSGKGATSITNPISLVAVVHDVDRTIYLHESQDRLTTGRLAAFVPDVLNVVRSVT